MGIRLLFIMLFGGCYSTTPKYTTHAIEQNESWGNEITVIATKLKAYSEELSKIDTLPYPFQGKEYVRINNLITEGVKRLYSLDTTMSYNIVSLFTGSKIYALQAEDNNFRIISWHTNNGGTFQAYNSIQQVYTGTKNYIYENNEVIAPKNLYKLPHKDSNTYLLISEGFTCGNCFDHLAETFIVDDNTGLREYNGFPNSESVIVIETRIQEDLVFNFAPEKNELKISYTIDDLNESFDHKMGDRINLSYNFDGRNFFKTD